MTRVILLAVVSLLTSNSLCRFNPEIREKNQRINSDR